MALFQSAGMTGQTPQENQYLRADPSTQPNANTSWMNPSDPTSSDSSMSSRGGISSTPISAPTPTNPNSGTMLGQIMSGGGLQFPAGPHTNQTPNDWSYRSQMNQSTQQPQQYSFMEGIDTNKLNDPNHNSPKYIASRILASGGSIQQAAQAVGGRVIDNERFEYPERDGKWYTIDTRRDATGENGQPGQNILQWLVMNDGAGNTNPGGPIQSMIGNPQQNNPWANNEMMQRIWQALQQTRQDGITAQRFNPTGGTI